MSYISGDKIEVNKIKANQMMNGNSSKGSKSSINTRNNLVNLARELLICKCQNNKPTIETQRWHRDKHQKKKKVDPSPQDTEG